MKLNLDSHVITMTCPQCHKQLKEKIGRLKRDKHITCPTCGRITVDTNQLRHIEESLNKELAKIPKTIKIKL